MRTEAEIRARIGVMKERAADPRTRRTYGVLLHTSLDALEWVLGEHDAENGLQAGLDADAARPMRWTRREDGAYVSDRGYVILKYGPGHWVPNRSDTEPIPNSTPASTLTLAKQQCARDYAERGNA